jgi:hypothetical protein
MSVGEQTYLASCNHKSVPKQIKLYITQQHVEIIGVSLKPDFWPPSLHRRFTWMEFTVWNLWYHTPASLGLLSLSCTDCL